jgi:N-acetylneuraminic acid mutarotase
MSRAYACLIDPAPPGGHSAYVDVYNATSSSWIRFPNGLGIARSQLAAASLPWGLVFFAGGMKNGELSADVDMYNATSNNWTHFPAQLGQARYGLAAASLPSGLVFFAGGHSE